MTKFKVYRSSVDEEDGSWTRTFLGHIEAEDISAARTAAIDKFGANHGPGGFNNTMSGDLRVFESGETVKLRGYLERKTKEKYQRQYYADQPWWNR